MKRVVARESQIVGTYDDETLLALLNGGTLRLADQYWDGGTSTWRPLTDFIGQRRSARRLIPALLRFAMLTAVAGCGSLVTWLALTQATPPAAQVQPAPPVPTLVSSVAPEITVIAAPEDAEIPPEERATPQPAPAKAPAPAVTLLSVEVFDEDVAVTVQNNGPDAVNGFDVRLKYFVLPGDQLIYDSNEKAIAGHEAAKLAAAARTKEQDAAIDALGHHLKIIGTDVITWTPVHIEALPSAEQWMAFGDADLGRAGSALSSLAAAFARGASSDDPVLRESALTRLLPDLGQSAGELKPLIEKQLQQIKASRNRLATERSMADEELASLRGGQEKLKPRLAKLMPEARKKTIRTEIVHVDAVIEPDLVQRITVKRQKNQRHGVVVELVRPDEKAVALSGRS